MAKQAPTAKRRHGLSRVKRLAAFTLFRDGFHPTVVGKLLGVSGDDVLNVLRRRAKGRR